MIRLLGIFLLVTGLYAVLFISDPNAMSRDNLQPLAQRQGFFGVLTLGVGLLIICGGIDLSIGSVVGLSAIAFAVLMQKGLPPLVAATLVLLMGCVIGLAHGVLVTLLRLQPFLVTLCGLFMYRGLARFLSATDVGTGTIRVSHADCPAWLRFLEWPNFNRQLDWLDYLAKGNVGGPSGVPATLVLLLALAALGALFLHGSVYGRYFFAIGTNEQAARYAGIVTWRYKILSYVLCSLLASLGGLLELLHEPSASPASSGSFYELYAITGAVLGGCSLRGGDGSIVGILLGTAVLPLLKNLTIWLPVPDTLQYTIIGLVLLLGTLVDELVRGDLRKHLATWFKMMSRDWRSARGVPGQKGPPHAGATATTS